jgi:PhzF family phenazine biosynthesis protein
VALCYNTKDYSFDSTLTVICYIVESDLFVILPSTTSGKDAKMVLLQYATVDVFTSPSSPDTSRFSEGNPLAIVRVPAGRVPLSQEQKQLIAREFNYSETTFIHEAADHKNTWKLEIFTAQREIPFAGHPTIGSAVYALSEVAEKTGSNSVKGAFSVKAGSILLEYDTQTKLAKATVPHDFHIHKNALSREELLILQPNLLQATLSPSPIASPVNGMTFALVPLLSLESLATISTTPLELPQLLLDEDWKSFAAQYFYHIYNQDASTSTTFIRTRMIDKWEEDAATGSAVCALACHLSLEAARSGQQDIRRIFDVTQGVEMGRKCLIRAEIELDPVAGAIKTVVLSGTAVEVMSGSMRVPIVG